MQKILKNIALLSITLVRDKNPKKLIKSEGCLNVKYS